MWGDHYVYKLYFVWYIAHLWSYVFMAFSLQVDPVEIFLILMENVDNPCWPPKLIGRHKSQHEKLGLGLKLWHSWWTLAYFFRCISSAATRCHGDCLETIIVAAQSLALVMGHNCWIHGVRSLPICHVRRSNAYQLESIKCYRSHTCLSTCFHPVCKIRLLTLTFSGSRAYRNWLIQAWTEWLTLCRQPFQMNLLLENEVDICLGGS